MKIEIIITHKIAIKIIKHRIVIRKKLINIIEPIPYNADTVSETLFDQEKNI